MTTQTIRKILTRDFILAFFVYFSLSSVFQILIPTLPIYLLTSGSTEAEIGVLIGIFGVSSLILRPFVGRALLKIPERTFMIVGALLYAFASVAYLLAPPFWPFLIVRVFHGIGYALSITASFTFVANITSESHRGQSLSYFVLAYNISGTLAPPLGMLLINHFGFTFLFLVCLGLSLCSLFIISKLKRKQITPLQGSSTEDVFFLNRKALPPSIVGFFSFFVWAALTAFFPLYAIANGVANPGFFFTTTATMFILGRTLGARILDLYRRESIILPSLTTYVISMVVLAFSKSLPMFIFVAVIYGIGGAFLFPTLVAYTLDRAGSPGPAMGTFYAITDLGMTLGPVIMGIILHVTSYPVMFLCSAFAGFIGLNYFFFLVRKKRGLFNDACDS